MRNNLKNLEVKNIIKSFSKRRVVNNINLSMNQGEVVGLLGPNGAGKTTTFHIIVGLMRPEKGEIAVDGKNILGLPMYKRAKLGLSYLPQEPSIFRKLTVEENILIVLEYTKLTSKERKSKVDRLMEEFSITKVCKSKGYMLSGGERRRVEIARTLALDPLFILLDEPFAGIDPIAIIDIQEIIGHLKKRNIGILITDHNVRETLKITDRSYIINNGEILYSGTAEEVSGNPQVRKIYLGQNFSL
ncbi:MAG: LPS export ABC transporter ATP-binding protein [Candidatus Firestonebacteria bacterium]|nr:LPS export ABC transporter ATP-binding protein [Candidatus Firestonebacteria bacterium]